MSSNEKSPLYPSSCPDNLQVLLEGFEDEQLAKQLGETVGKVILEVGRVLDIDSLSLATISYDYANAVGAVGRGVDGLQKQVPTQTKHVQGVAMTLQVLENGAVNSKIVFDANNISNILSNDKKSFEICFGLIAHELGHVQDHKYVALAFPDFVLKKVFSEDAFENYLYTKSSAYWSEYAACKASAVFSDVMLELSEETILQSLSTYIEDISNLKLQFRLYGNAEKCSQNIANIILGIISLISYHIGLVEGIDGACINQNVIDILEKCNLKQTYLKLKKILNDISELDYQWDSVEVFDPINKLILETLEEGGLHFSFGVNGEAFVVIS